MQELLWSRGFPCLRPLGRRGTATLEEWRDEGEYRDGHEAEVRRALAWALGSLIRITGELGHVPSLLREFFPGGEGALWPVPHNVLVARGEALAREECRAVGASATYTCAYSARCVNAVGGDARLLPLQAYADAFL